MSMGFRADPTNTSGVITVAGVDQVVVTNASNVVATTFTGALAGNADTATALSTATGAAPSYGARAWVNFDGTRDTTGAVSTANTNRLIRASGNVSSVSRTGTGLYNVNFAIPFLDANYAAIFGSKTGSNTGQSITIQVGGYTQNATKNNSFVTVFVSTSSGANYDEDMIDVVIFR